MDAQPDQTTTFHRFQEDFGLHLEAFGRYFWLLFGSLGFFLVSLGTLLGSLGLRALFLEPWGFISEGFRHQKARFGLQRNLKNDAPTIAGAPFSEN